MCYTYGVLYLSRSINTHLDQRVSEPLMYTQFLEIVDSGKAYSLTAVAWERSWVDLGVGRGGRGHPFFLEIVFYFYRTLRKIKRISMAGKWASVPATPF